MVDEKVYRINRKSLYVCMYVEMTLLLDTIHTYHQNSCIEIIAERMSLWHYWLEEVCDLLPPTDHNFLHDKACVHQVVHMTAQDVLTSDGRK